MRAGPLGKNISEYPLLEKNNKNNENPRGSENMKRVVKGAQETRHRFLSD